MTRPNISTLHRARIFLAHDGKCHLCNAKINPSLERYDIEHVIARGIGGTDHESNLRPAHIDCHAIKTKADMVKIAKVNRIQKTRAGVKARSKVKWAKRGAYVSNTKDINQDLTDQPRGQCNHDTPSHHGPDGT